MAKKKRRQEILTLVVVFTGVLLASALAVYFLGDARTTLAPAPTRRAARSRTRLSPGSIVYAVDVSPMISTDEISADILAIDGQSVRGIEWDQKKSYSYLYQ
jgi:hypothetical protein